MRWDLILVRKTKNRINPDITRRKLKKVAESATRNKSLGFQTKLGRMDEPTLVLDEEAKEELYRYSVRLRVSKPCVRNPETVGEKFEHVLNVLKRCAESEGWEVHPDHRERGEVGVGPMPAAATLDTFKPPELTPGVFDTFFGDVYERDAHIRTVHGAVVNAIESDGKLLSHILLYGLPGSCKTKLTERLKSWYEHGSKAERVSFVDGTTMTKAGLENWLLDLADGGTLPEVLVVDELEKQPMDNLLCLNNVMGSGVLTKLNARTGNVRTRTRFVVIGLCNDEEAIKKFRSGALWSRFTHKLRCVRPSRELCEFILRQEVSKLPGGKDEWADAALSFGWDQLGQRDIREIKGHLDGRDRLLSGEWQMDQMSIIAAARAEDAALSLSERTTILATTP